MATQMGIDAISLSVILSKAKNLSAVHQPMKYQLSSKKPDTSSATLSAQGFFVDLLLRMTTS